MSQAGGKEPPGVLAIGQGAFPAEPQDGSEALPGLPPLGRSPAQGSAQHNRTSRAQLLLLTRGSDPLRTSPPGGPQPQRPWNTLPEVVNIRNPL